jgi:iron(III) transport system permease protein
VCWPAILDISIYMFVNAMITASVVVFVYGPDTALASVAVLDMDDVGDIAPAAAMGGIDFLYHCGRAPGASLCVLVAEQWLQRRTPIWRQR